MKYMIVECHTSYAVALDENGRFLKVANMHYQVGQSVTEVVEMRQPEDTAQPAKKNHKWMYAMVSAAACFLLLFTTLFTINNNVAYATIFMTINPEVRVDVNRNDVVVGLNGVNDDGKQLIADYSYKKKQLNVVMDELVDLAIEKGFLSDGDKITLEFDADDNDWIISHSDNLSESMNEHLKDKMSVTIQIGGEKTSGEETTTIEQTIVEQTTVVQTIVQQITIQETTVVVQPETSVPETTQAIVVETQYTESEYETTGSEPVTTKKQTKPSNNKQSSNEKKEETTTKKSSKKKNNKNKNNKDNGNNSKSEETTKDNNTTSNVSWETDYGSSDYESTDDGSPDYEVTEEGDSNYDESDDGSSDYSTSDDGSSNYEEGASDYE